MAKANVKFVLDADEAAAVQGFLKVVDAQRKSERQFDKTNEKQKQQKKTQESATSSGIKDLGRMAAGWLSVGAAIGIASKAMSAYNDLRDKAKEAAKDTRFSLGTFSQLANGDPKEMARMVKEAKATNVEAGMPLNDAARLQFNLESFGIADLRKMFADLYGTVESPSDLAEAAVTTQTSFGEKETGSIRNIINKGLAASALSKTTLEEMSTSSAQIGPVMTQIKASDEESLAALAILSKARKSADLAATEINSLGATLMEQGLSGKGLFAGIGAISKQMRGKTDAQQLEFFGRKEGFRAYQTLLAQGPEVQSAYRDIIAANNQPEETDNVSKAIAVRKVQLENLEANARQEQALNLALLEEKGDEALKTERAQSKVAAESIRAGESGLTTVAKQGAMATAKTFGAGEVGVQSAAGGVDALASASKAGFTFFKGIVPGAGVASTAADKDSIGAIAAVFRAAIEGLGNTQQLGGELQANYLPTKKEISTPDDNSKTQELMIKTLQQIEANTNPKNTPTKTTSRNAGEE